jgi:hypothetical protein
MAIVSAAMVGMLAFETPAAAHFNSAAIYDGLTTLGWTYVYDGHYSADVCDKKADGVGIYARFKLDDGQIVDVADSNGSADPCAHYLTPDYRRIVSFETVWRGGKSSGWKTA